MCEKIEPLTDEDRAREMRGIKQDLSLAQLPNELLSRKAKTNLLSISGAILIQQMPCWNATVEALKAEIERLQPLGDRERLACLLTAYEADEPHDDEEDKSGQAHYPVITPEELRSWLSQEHCGDCTGMAGACMRCHAEYAMHKAEWIINNAVAHEEKKGNGQGVADPEV